MSKMEGNGKKERKWETHSQKPLSSIFTQRSLITTRGFVNKGRLNKEIQGENTTEQEQNSFTNIRYLNLMLRCVFKSPGQLKRISNGN